MNQWDAIIIGGGPAGSSAAIALARHGHKILLVEKVHFPHDKVCGEFLSPESIPLLEELIPTNTLVGQEAIQINRVQITTPTRQKWVGSFPSKALGLSRRALDSELLDGAKGEGACVEEGAQVVAIRGDIRQGYDVDIQINGVLSNFRSKVLIGAYGKRSRLDVVLGRKFIHHEQEFLALKAHFFGPSLKNWIELHTFPGGYCGLSNIETGKQNVCMLVRQSIFQGVVLGSPKPVEGFITWLRSQNVSLNQWFNSAERIHPTWLSIAQVPFEAKESDLRGILFTGDAAGLIAPFAGDGITIALETGCLAAEISDQYLVGKISHDQLSILYSQEWRHRYQRRMELGRVLQKLLLHPKLSALVIGLLSTFPDLGNLLMMKTRGKIADQPQPYRQN